MARKTKLGCTILEGNDIADLPTVSENNEILEEEIGAYIFYLSALCNTLDINLSEAVLKEYGNMKTLGIFSLK